MPERSIYSRPSDDSAGLNLIGKSLDQFHIVDYIGSGGMACVFKAYQPNLDRYVAVKVLLADHARNPIFLKRFSQEARAVAKLVHPNILQIYDFGDQENIPYIVMEYVGGGTLKDRLKTPLPVAEAVNCILQVAAGLDCAHRNNIIHRDVKPANILLRKDRRPLLSDLGIAKIIQGPTINTRPGSLIGTPVYMSPEQGTGLAVDHRSDIYSLGIVLFHCLTGYLPFRADTPIKIIAMHLGESLPIKMVIENKVPDPVVQVLMKMTAKDPNNRYQSIDAVIDALSSAVGELISLRTNIQQLDIKYSDAPLPAAYTSAGTSVHCFRCGEANPSTRLFCITCGYELADKFAVADRYMGPNGRPLLARLTMQNGAMGGRSYRFHQIMTTIGRTNGNDLIFSGRTVSRRHALLWFDNGRWYLEDLQSANGTLVNGVYISQPQALNDGDLINFGDEIVVFNVTSNNTYHKSLPIANSGVQSIDVRETTIISKD